MAVRKPDTSEGFAPRVDVGEALALPANNCLRLDGRLDAGLLSPSLHQTLLDLARLHNVVSSLRIEGEVIALDEARRVLDSQRASTPTERGALQLSKAYSDLARNRFPEFSVGGFQDAHRALFHDVLEDGITGVLKTEQNVLLEGRTLREKFVPTPPERTERELRSVLEWFDANAFSLPVPVTAAVFFAEFQAIHPFVDGNGRLGRYLNVALLKKLGLRNAPLVPLDTRFFRSQRHYYEMLGTTNSGRDYHHWTRYFVKQAEAAYELAVSRADLRPVVERFRSNAARSVLGWVLAGDGGWFRRGDFPNPKRYSAPALTNALRELTRANVLEAEGELKGRRYRLRSKFLADVHGRDL